MMITNLLIRKFREILIEDEKAEATVKKYVHDISALSEWLNGKPLTRDLLLEYKSVLQQNYKASSVNAALASLNSFFSHNNKNELKMKSIRIQKQVFTSEDRELKGEEYRRMLEIAKDREDERMCLLLQTICSTGIRVSELKFITVEAIKSGAAVIDCKGKQRAIIIGKDLCGLLSEYAQKRGITAGSIFITRNGNPLDRSNICKAMKKLAEAAKVTVKKVFPHNLRHLFARTYYSVFKDISRLADILGHSNINTTRIYTRESGDIHRKQIESLHLIY